tara:strand:- start:460 stop:1281 length:822 start_codon:yes stop_codon:yes gene_type:complete
MKLALASDLHFEFHRDPAWLPRLAGIHSGKAPDILVLAGDISIGDGAIEAVERISNDLPDAVILWVAGNHEYFHQNYDDTLEKFKQAFQDSERIHFLERDAVEINGWHFLGCTLWTGFDGLPEFPPESVMSSARDRIADYRLIRTGPESELWRPEDAQLEHQLSVAWLQQELANRPANRTVVISHFPPSMRLHHLGFPVDISTPYFNASLDDLIEKYQPGYWLYGHNHWSDLQCVGKTALLSNQLGYPREKGIPEFDPQLLVTLVSGSGVLKL